MSPDLAEQKQIESYRAMTGEERLAIGLRLHELSCEIARESIRSQFRQPLRTKWKSICERIRLAYMISSNEGKVT